MALFDPATAYADDWRYFDDVYAASLVPGGRNVDRTQDRDTDTVQVRFLSPDSSDYQSLGRGLDHSVDSRLAVVWLDGSSTVPAVNDRLEIGDATWVVQSITATIRSYYVAALVEGGSDA